MNRMESVLALMSEPTAWFGANGFFILGNASWVQRLELLALDHMTALKRITCLSMGGWREEDEGSFQGAFERGLSEVLAGSREELEGEVSIPRLETGLPWRFKFRARAVAGEGMLVALREDFSDHRLQQDLRESHTLFHHLLENTQDGVFLYDKEGRYILANTVYAESVGFTPAELAGRNLFEVFKPDLAQMLHEQNLLVLSTGLTLHFEIVIQTPRGPRTVFVTKDPYRNHRNEVVGVFGIARDITGHREAEQTLEKSERHFRALIENSADRVALIGQDGTIRYVSPSTKRILGYEMEDLVNTNAFLWVYPGDLPEVTRRFEALLEMPGASVTGQYRVLRKDGRWQWMEATATNLLNDPSIGSIVVNERDITERKKTEVELLRHAQIVFSSHDAIISASPEGEIQSWNPAAERIFGYTQAEAIGQRISILVSEEMREAALARQTAVLRGRSAHEVETVFLTKAGRPVEVSLTISPIRDQERRIIGFSKIVRDVTERVQLEREILEISEREKQSLGQDLHDDLCQQLVGISLLANLLVQEMEKCNNAKGLEEARQIRQLTGEAVDHARNVARGLCPLNLADSGFVASIQSLVANAAQVYRTECIFECQEILTFRNLSMATHFYRIIQEALHNAVKHSQANRVVVHLARRGADVEAVVEDDGVGLPERSEEKSAAQGSLGLHTMSYRARFIKGSLEFQSRPGGGTRVVCRIPYRRCQEEMP